MITLSGDSRVSMSVIPKITLRGFRPDERGVGQVLGELQTAVMELLWQEPNLTVNEVEERLQRRREIAHTTVLTTLDRMHRKGYLIREKQGKAFIYAPRYSREEFEQKMAQEVLGALLGQFTEPALSAFIDIVSEDSETLDRLDKLIKEKRRQQAEAKKKR
jgi:predicted transcriptional regulator